MFFIVWQQFHVINYIIIMNHDYLTIKNNHLIFPILKCCSCAEIQAWYRSNNNDTVKVSENFEEFWQKYASSILPTKFSWEIIFVEQTFCFKVSHREKWNAKENTSLLASQVQVFVYNSLTKHSLTNFIYSFSSVFFLSDSYKISWLHFAVWYFAFDVWHFIRITLQFCSLQICSFQNSNSVYMISIYSNQILFDTRSTYLNLNSYCVNEKSLVAAEL